MIPDFEKLLNEAYASIAAEGTPPSDWIIQRMRETRPETAEDFAALIGETLERYAADMQQSEILTTTEDVKRAVDPEALCQTSEPHPAHHHEFNWQDLIGGYWCDGSPRAEAG